MKSSGEWAKSGGDRVSGGDQVQPQGGGIAAHGGLPFIALRWRQALGSLNAGWKYHGEREDEDGNRANGSPWLFELRTS